MLEVVILEVVMFFFPYCFFLHCEVRDMLAKAYQILEIGEKSETRNSCLLSKFQTEVILAQIYLQCAAYM